MFENFSNKFHRGEASTTFFAAPHSSRMIEIPAGCGILKVCLIYSRAESCAND